jgi:hypothetical protein
MAESYIQSRNRFRDQQSAADVILAGSIATGEVARTVEAEITDLGVNLARFGLVANDAGAAAANTTKMQAALAYAAGKRLRFNIPGTIYLSVASFSDTLTPAAGTTLDFDRNCLLRWDTQYPLFLLQYPNISLLGPNLRSAYVRTEDYLAATDIRPFNGVDLTPLGSDNASRINAWCGLFINGGAQGLFIVDPDFQIVTQTHLGCIYAWVTALEDTSDVLPTINWAGGYVSGFVQGIAGRVTRSTMRDVRFGKWTQPISGNVPAGHAVYIAYDTPASQTLMYNNKFSGLYDEGTFLDSYAKTAGAYRGEVIQTSLLTADYSSLGVYTAAQAAALTLADGDWFRPVYGRAAQNLSASMPGITSCGRDDIVRYEGSSTWSKQAAVWNLESFKFRGMLNSTIENLTSLRSHGALSGGDYCSNTSISGVTLLDTAAIAPRSYPFSWQDENAGVNNCSISDLTLVRGAGSWPLLVLGSKTAGVLSANNSIRNVHIKTDVGPLDNDFNDFMLKLYLCASEIDGLVLNLRNAAAQTLEGVKLIELTSYVTAPYATIKFLRIRGRIDGLALPQLYSTAGTAWAAEDIYFDGALSMATASSGTSIPMNSGTMVFTGQHTATRTYTVLAPKFTGQRTTLIASVDVAAVVHNFDGTYRLNGTLDANSRYIVTGTVAGLRLDLIGSGSEWIVGYKDALFV